MSDVVNSGCGGGSYGYPVFTNSVIIGCKAEKTGGANHGGIYAFTAKIINNESASHGGGFFRPNYAFDCEFYGNKAEGDGGALYCDSSYGHARRSIFMHNQGASGGAIYSIANVSNCYIACNIATTGNGGGVYAYNSSDFKLLDSVVCSNQCINGSASVFGGGVAYTTAERCEIFGNYARHAGGTYYGRFFDCNIHDNLAQSYGGGVYGGKPVRCRISNNSTLADAGSNFYDNGYAATGFEYCDISGTSIDGGGYAIGCTVHDMLKPVELVNVYTNGFTRSCSRAWAGSVAFTNCVFVNNGRKVEGYLRLFGKPSSVVNCTFVSNRVAVTFTGCSDTAHPLVVENSVFVNNYFCFYNSDGDLVDLPWALSCAPGGVLFKNCVYGKAYSTAYSDPEVDGKMRSENIYPDAPVYRSGVDIPSDMRFTGNSEHPFSLKGSSPLRKRGNALCWADSAETATDKAGKPRLSLGKVDIGAYQFQPSGLFLLVR